MARSRNPPSLEEIFAGRAKIDFEGLFRLIHDLNPTGRGLGSAREAQAYVEKSRLQSLLIRRHGELLDLRACPGDPGIVSILHALTGRDAGHARVDTLDEDARAWVRDRLSEQELGGLADKTLPRLKAASQSGLAPSLPPGPKPRGEASSLVDRGRAALADYDFEEARALFDQALEADPSDVSAARGLVELLVDHLAADDEACDLRLLPEVACDESIQAGIALAASRAGRSDRLFPLLPGLSPERVVEVLEALIDSAIQRDDIALALDGRQRLAAIAPGAPSLVGIDQRMERALVQRYAAEEASISRFTADGRWEEAESAARDLLARWGGSAVARRTLREVEDREKATQITQRAARLDEALSRGLPDEARRWMREIKDLGGSVEAWSPRIAEVERQLRQANESRRAKDVLDALLQPDPEGMALLAWLDLSPPLRSWVSERHSSARSDLTLLESLSPSGGARARGAVIAVIAVRAARHALDRGEPYKARETIAPHEELLRAVLPGATFLRELREAAGRRDADRVAHAEETVRSALDRGDLDAARTAIDSIADVGPECRQRLDALRTTCALVSRRREAEQSVRDLAARGDWLAIRRDHVAGQMHDVPADVRDLLEQSKEQVRETWRLRTTEEPLLGLNALWERSVGYPSPNIVDAEGRVVVARIFHRSLFVVTIEAGTSRVVRVHQARLPRPCAVVSSCIEDQNLLICTDNGDVIEFSCSDGDILDYCPGESMLRPGEILEGVFIIPGTSLVWAELGPEPFRTIVFDWRARKGVRELQENGLIATFVPGRNPCVSTCGDTLRFFTPRGRPMPPSRVKRLSMVQQIVSDPFGAGWYLLRAADPPLVLGDSEEDDDEAYLERMDAQGREMSGLLLPGTRAVTISHLAVSSELQMMYVITYGSPEREDWVFWGISIGPDCSPTLRWRLEFSGESDFFSEPSCGRVVLGHATARAIKLHTMNADPPDLESGEVLIRFPRLTPSVLYCHKAGTFETPKQSFTRTRSHQADVESELSSLIEDDADLPALVRCIRSEASRRPGILELLERAWRLHPQEPYIALHHAMATVGGCRWSPALEGILAGIVTDGFDDADKAHLLHLRAWDALMRGDTDAATEWLNECEAFGTCTLEDLAAAIAVASDPQATRADHSVEAALAIYRCQADEADRLAERGEWLESIRALDALRFWDIADLQVLARRARAWLARGSIPAIEQPAQHLALAAFYSAWEGSRAFARLNLPLVSDPWSWERITTLAGEVERFLDPMDSRAALL